MHRKSLGLALAGAGVTAATVWSAIPEPDTVLYGQIFVSQILVPASAGASVIARVDGVANPIGQYRLGENEAAGDLYVLRLRVESLADGTPPSANAARLGQSTHLFVRFGTGPEFPAGDFVLSQRGQIQYLDLGQRLRGDWNGDAAVTAIDLPAFVECMRGPVPTAGQCVAAFDFDANSTVDLKDYVAFEAAVAGG